MSKRSFRVALAVVIASIVLVVGVLVYFINRALDYPDERHAGTGRDVEIEIVSGMSFPGIASLMSEKDVLDKPTWFRLFAMWNGKTADVKTGKYLIKDNLTPRELLEVLVKGVKEVTVKVTLPEGENMLEFFDKLEKAKVTTAAELEKLARDKDFLGKHAITGETAEGYLFPDTYQFRLGEKASVVLERLIARHQAVWQELLAKHPGDAAKLKDKLKWSDRDILTMASIVEKEAIDPKERPTIAQVFVNRLTSPTFKPRLLQTDPTIRYGCLIATDASRTAPCKAWLDACAEKQKKAGCGALEGPQIRDKDNVYNTYQHEGLPPGPIANPGRASIEATLAPDNSDYFYFVATSKNSRNHAFARTVDEHDRNVEKYRHSKP